MVSFGKNFLGRALPYPPRPIRKECGFRVLWWEVGGEGSGLVQRVWSGRQKPLKILEIGRNFISKSGAYTIFVRAERVKAKETTAIFLKTQKCMNHRESVTTAACSTIWVIPRRLPRALAMPSVCNCCVYAPAYSCSQRIMAFPPLPPLNSTGFLLIGRTEPEIMLARGIGKGSSQSFLWLCKGKVDADLIIDNPTIYPFSQLKSKDPFYSYLFSNQH